jgi:hypothetical protein
MAHGDAREGKWRGNLRMEWVASTLLTTSEHGVSSITTADAHTSTASSLLNWRPRRFKWTRPFRLKTKSGIRACAITFQLVSNKILLYSAPSLDWCWQGNTSIIGFEVCHPRCVFRYNGLGYVIVKRTQLCGYVIIFTYNITTQLCSLDDNIP